MPVRPFLRLIHGTGGVRGLLLAVGLSVAWGGACDTDAALERIADIRWTAHGIPHIRADSERGLGYGIGYAYARDNACLLLDEIITARGERSRYFGADGTTAARVDNLTSDIFHAWLNGEAQLDAFWQAQPEPVRQRLTGYAQGFNRYLDDANRSALSCRDEPWLQRVSERDLIRLTRSLLVEGGLKQFVGPLVAATRPHRRWWQRWFNDAVEPAADAGRRAAAVDGRWRNGTPVSSLGSNAVAVGAARSANGRGLLLANPHFPWREGRLRFYQMHLTIPGQLDVMGAALAGLPLINIGFNRGVAWSHTVDASSHFTLYRLKLDPARPGHYLVDGRSLPLRKTTVEIAIRDRNGALSSSRRDIYESRHGPLVIIPGLLEWRRDEAYALRDANLDNTRVLQQWDAINRAQDVAQLRAAVERIQGIPWVNTIAVDAPGQALYMNQSVIPHLSQEQLRDCASAEFTRLGLVVLDGERRYCDWTVDEHAAQPGIVPAQGLPVLLRDDYVQNSNDSAWLSNPARPLTGFSPLVSRERRPLGPRTRFAIERLDQEGKLAVSDLRHMVTDNRVYLGGVLMNDLLELCAQQKELRDIQRPCSNLVRWDGTAGLDSGQGLLVFDDFLKHFLQVENGWRKPFDPEQPVDTPQGINLDDADVVAAVIAGLVDADAKIQEMGLAESANWGALQVATRNGRKIGIPGAPGEMGVYNVIESELQDGRFEVKRGSSYIQLVTFTDDGPKAQGLMAYSQSGEPLSAHYSDQTELFSRQIWPELPFDESQIEGDPELERFTLWQR